MAIDWERIEADHALGVKSIREIAAEHGVSDMAIRKRAKRDGWTRDLSARVKAKADELVRTQLVRKEVRKGKERELVEGQAEFVASVRIKQQKQISKTVELAKKMIDELEAVTDDPKLFRDLAEFLRSEDKEAVDARMKTFEGVISMSGRVENLKKLAETLKNLIALERQAYGINDGDGADTSSGIVFKWIS